MDRKLVNDFSSQFFTGIQEHYLKFLGQELKELIDAAKTMTGGDGYLHDAHVYFVDPKDGTPLVNSLKHVPGGVTPPALPAVLVPKHQEWLGHYEDFQGQWPRILQSFGSLIARAKENQDLRDMFPDYLIQPVLQHHAIVGLTRSRPDLYAGNPSGEDYRYQRATREAVWDEKMLQLYESVGPLVDRYMGFKFL